MIDEQGNWIFTVPKRPRPTAHQHSLPVSNSTWVMRTGWFIDDLVNFPSSFYMGQHLPTYASSGGVDWAAPYLGKSKAIVEA